jgi:hypothetical protein
MTDQFRRHALPPTRLSGNYIYTKLQIHYGGDVQDIVLKSEEEPSCRDLAKVLQETFRIPVDDQLIYFRGQRLHHHHSSSTDQTLARYGIFSGNTMTLVGKRGLL